MRKLFELIRWRVKTIWHRLAAIRLRRRAPPAGAAPGGENQLDQQLVTQLSRPGRFTFRQFRHVGKLLGPRERRQVTVIFGIALASLAFLLVRWIGRHVTAVPIVRGSYTEGLIGAPQFINPLLAQSNDVDADIASLIFSGLFRYDERLKPTPDLAESYRVSDGGKTYVVRLKPNLRWHDGSPLTADDVVFTYASAQDPAFHSPLRQSLSGVQVQKTGEREVTFNLPEPYDRFLDLLTTGLLPEHLWGEIPPIQSTLTEYNLSNPIGSGPWRFKSLTKERHGNIKSYTLIPFPEAPGSRPYLQEITFKFYPKERVAAALNTRAVDGIAYVPREYEEELTDPQIKRYTLMLPQYTAIFFNQQAAPALRDRSVRQALAAAVDREKILTEAVKLKGEIAEGPILPNAPGYDPALRAPAYDPTAAEQLLDGAGWNRIEAATFVQLQPGSTTTATTSPMVPLTATATPAPGVGKPAYERRNAAGNLLELALTTVVRPENVEAAALVAEFWRAVGVRVTVNVVPQERIFREVVIPRNFLTFLYGVAVGVDPDPYPFWHSSQVADPGLNLAGLANRQIDKLLEEARAANNATTKAATYGEFGRAIAAEIPAVFLYTPTYTYAQHAKVKGFNLSQITLPQHRFINISQWYVATGWRWR